MKYWATKCALNNLNECNYTKDDVDRDLFIRLKKEFSFDKLLGIDVYEKEGDRYIISPVDDESINDKSLEFKEIMFINEQWK